MNSLDASPVVASRRSFAAKPPQLKSLSISDRPFSSSTNSPFKADSPHSSKWTSSPRSAVASPSLLSSGLKGRRFADPYQSPSIDASSIASSSSTSISAPTSTDWEGDVKMETKFGRIPPQAQSRRAESNLSLAMNAVSRASAAAVTTTAAKSTSPASSDFLSANSNLDNSFGDSKLRTNSAGVDYYGQQSLPGGAAGSGHDRQRGQKVGGRSYRGSDQNHGSFGGSQPEIGSGSQGVEPGPPGLPGLHDSGGFTIQPSGPSDSDYPMAEFGGMRHLHLEDHNHHQHPPPQSQPRELPATAHAPFPASPPRHLHSSHSRQGMKRKPLSPHREASQEKRPAPAQPQKPQQKQSASPATPGQPQFSLSHNPFLTDLSSSNLTFYSSAYSIGLTNGSFVSSPGLSVGDGNMTPASSQNPMSQPEQFGNQTAPYPNSFSLDPGLQISDSQVHAQLASDAAAAAAAAQKLSAENSSRVKQNNQPKLQATIHICDCCPKKPKKFDTIEELR